jgi:trichohyalin
MKEEKLRKGIIESEQLEKEERTKTVKLDFSKIRIEIEQLKELKNLYVDKENLDKAIEISEKIIVLAFSNKLKSVVDEEKRYLELLRDKRKKIAPMKEIPEEEKDLEIIPEKKVEESAEEKKEEKKIDLLEVQEETELKEEKLKVEEKDIDKIKKEIEHMSERKNQYHDKGEYDKAIEISEKIIVLAFSNKFKDVVNEENKFLELLKNEKQKSMVTTEIPEGSNYVDLTKNKAIGKSVKKESADLKLDLKIIEEKQKLKEERAKFEKDSLILEEEKEKLVQEKLKFEEAKEAFNYEKQMLEEMKQYERDKDIHINDAEAKGVVEITESEKIVTENNSLKQEREKIEKEKKKVEQEKWNLEEEKKDFEKYKLMLKDQNEKFEQEKKDFQIDKEKLKQKKIKLKEQKELFEENWMKFQDDKKKLEREKLKFEEERDTFRWEKQMFDELKKHEREKESQ